MVILVLWLLYSARQHAPLAGRVPRSHGMNKWRAWLFFAMLMLVLWLLYPARQLAPQRVAREHVVEITYMGPNDGTNLDVYREFEKWSEARHARDPRFPVYRVLAGLNATRDQTADPTRFLLAEAGGSPRT